MQDDTVSAFPGDQAATKVPLGGVGSTTPHPSKAFLVTREEGVERVGMEERGTLDTKIPKRGRGPWGMMRWSWPSVVLWLCSCLL